MRRQSIAAHRQSLRCDKRSMKFKATRANGAVQSGVLAKSILKTLKLDESESAGRGIIEDLRLDRFGTYYVQIREKDFENVSSRIVELLNTESILKLEGLGSWLVSPPSESRCAGKRPIIIDTIPFEWSPSQCVEEIWLSNAEMWGLNLDEKDAHIAEGVRMSRKRKPDEPQPKPGQDWIEMKSVKIYVSHQVFAILQKCGLYVRFNYSFLSVREYVVKKQQCQRCLQYGSHSAATCRNAAKCVHCGGRHLSTECPSRPRSPEHNRKSGDHMELSVVQDPTEDLEKNLQFTDTETPFFNSLKISTSRGADYMEEVEQTK